MRRSISKSDLQLLLREADLAAHRLLRQLRLPRAELADIRQEFLVDLIARLPAFDARRGSLGAFANVVLGHKASRLAAKTKRDRRLYGAIPVSLDEVLPDTDGQTRGDLIGENEGLAACLGQPTDAFAAVDQRLDVERGLGALDRGQGALCAALSHSTVDTLAAQGRGARSSLYRSVKDIRLSMLALGLRPA